MTDKLKCPFCGQELRNCCAGVIYTCSKPDSCPHEQCYGSKEFWQELIRTRKALKIAVDALKEYEDADSYDCNGDWCGCEYSTAHKALTKITALEQKDEK